MNFQPDQVPARSTRVMANRERLYEAAIALFEQKGFHHTSMEEIAKSAGMARASAFNHFPSKLLFLAEFFHRFTSEVIEAASSAKISGFRDQLEGLFAAIGPIAHANKPIMREITALTMGHGPLAPVESEVDDEMLSFFRTIVMQGQKNGEVVLEWDQDFLAELMLGLLTVTANDWVNQGQERSLQAELSRRFEVLLRGMAA
jgi:AcrR family transcriptional regulator